MSHRCSAMAPTDRTTIATGIHGLTLSSPVITSAMVAIVTATMAATTTMTLRRRWWWMASTIVSTTGAIDPASAKQGAIGRPPPLAVESDERD